MDDLQPEYNFRHLRGVVRGKYAAGYQKRCEWSGSLTMSDAEFARRGGGQRGLAQVPGLSGGRGPEVPRLTRGRPAPPPRFAMYLKMAKRLLFETDKRLLWKLAWNMGFKGMLSVAEAQAPAASAARSSRRSCTSRSSTAATCAARAAGSMSPPSRRRSSRTRSTS